MVKQSNKPLWQDFHALCFLLPTTVGTEAICLVCVKVASGGTPAVSVAAALGGTALILLTQEGEGKDTGGSIRVSVKCVQDCENYSRKSS